jgi:hypothetical protein
MAAVHDAEQVHVHDPAPVLGGQVPERGQRQAAHASVAGVGHEHVDRSDAGDGRGHGVQVGDVERRGLGPAAVLSDRDGDLLGPLGHDVVDVDGRPPGGQRSGDAGTDVLAGTGDEGDSVIQVEHVATVGAHRVEMGARGVTVPERGDATVRMLGPKGLPHGYCPCMSGSADGRPL